MAMFDQEEPAANAEMAYLEGRATKLVYQQILTKVPEENLTLLDDQIITAQLASIYLE